MARRAAGGPPEAEPAADAGPAARSRAALIYQHKTAAAGRAIADALSAQIECLEQAHSDGMDTS